MQDAADQKRRITEGLRVSSIIERKRLAAFVADEAAVVAANRARLRRAPDPHQRPQRGQDRHRVLHSPDARVRLTRKRSRRRWYRLVISAEA